LWDPVNYEVRHRFLVEGGTANGLAISSDGRWLAAACMSRGIRVWDLSTNTLATQLTSDVGIETAVAFSPDGKTLVSASGIVWDVASGQRRTGLTVPWTPNCIAIAPDNVTVAMAGNDLQVLLWNLNSPQAPPTQLGRHRTYVHCLAFSPDGKALLSGSEDGVVTLWNLSNPELKRSFRRHTGAVAGAAFSPTSHLVATVSWDGSVKLWDPVTEKISRQQGHPGQVLAVAFAPDGNSLLSGGQDGQVRVWDLATRPDPLILQGHKGLIRAVAFSHDGQSLLSAGADKTFRLWDLAGEGPPLVLYNAQREQAAWVTAKPHLLGGGHSNPAMGGFITTDNKVLTADFGGRIRLWDQTLSGEPAEFEETDGPLWSIALSPDGKTLAAAGYRSNTVILWNVETRKKRCTLSGHTDRVWSVAFSPDGRTLASGGNDRMVLLWDVENATAAGKIPVPVEWVYTLAFSPDGRTLAIAGGDNRARLYDPITGREQNPLGQHPATIRSLVFFPDGKTLATGSDDGTVKLWDLATRQERITLRVPPFEQESTLADGTRAIDLLDSSVWSLTVAKDGQALAAGDGDGRITVWRAATQSETTF
jgi:WD40 repeat protein